ncbi:hypothetical protein BU042_05535 [Staphylococcus simulans]|uniref:TetR/AcrR family transcriptional regulator n=1 Tax=Staphylococcus simulans TaxID=1286 RepID=UPI000D09D670|nr:TetR/AcrR family transcriptional regulator [Staphylococcus simulans]AVO03196.1 hypothetical protein BI282_12615 [Staphylococcus simulans]AVO06151.1 hypothetical protein BI283_12630 [Staphylococcus simulans]AWG19744.1 hypothetical protein A9958_12620 [Staphylococcus simulans]AWI02692.1 hypothetical protein A7X73_12510 [Staphylococcus simulans]PTI95907.1 hypothetical protein BU048_12300 [Staphylococcus simulans]
MSSLSTNNKTKERLEKIDEAIVNLKRGKNKLSIAQIAKKAGIARKTIYNHAELKERCDQAIHIQDLEHSSNGPNVKKTISGRELLEQRYRNTKGEFKKEQEKNAKLLENNRQLVLEKDRLKSHIQMLQSKIERLEAQKIKPLK